MPHPPTPSRSHGRRRRALRRRRCPGSQRRRAFEAGTSDPTAGAYSPFVLQAWPAPTAPSSCAAIDATLPKGLIAKLAGIPYCSDAALAAAAAPQRPRRAGRPPSCPAASRGRHRHASAPAPARPLLRRRQRLPRRPLQRRPAQPRGHHPGGRRPLRPRHRGQVRNALYVDPETAQVHVVSDRSRTILDGIPLDLRSICVNLDRADFTLNPTNCAAGAITRHRRRS